MKSRVTVNITCPWARRASAWISMQTVPGIMTVLLTAWFAVTVRVATATGAADAQQQYISDASHEWRFRVYLDDKEIGYHNFYLKENGGMQIVRSVAEFEYKLLFVRLYQYEHRNDEHWQGDCLQSIESRTDANGKPFSVSGRIQSGTFIVRGDKGKAELPSCVMTFAYWNPRFLEQKQLLNSQNGEYLEVEISPPVMESLDVRGEQQTAWRYSLAAGQLQLDLWYSRDRQWLGLESTTESGRVLRYELL
jgi:hypothetical protein